ncbi:hypothetical protein NUH88_11775 [Nisaea acidiphila]|uniref:Uncharacterized protein n=1 Tax=Nisaea acidiphila TaxID=1862145 RepID=A0A9J7ALP8_9PROT|nr:hypothetical protein [Nisaea acidiphila]UUX48095.1 hypothetical protein NUH88_11775 [Nisaea acidiphila]
MLGINVVGDAGVDQVRDVVVPLAAAGVGALIGGLATLVGTLFSMRVKRRDERRSIAAMLAAEIESVVRGAINRGHIEYYEGWAKALEEGTVDPSKHRPGLFGLNADMPDIAKAVLPRVGLLGSELVRDVTVWYAAYRGVLHDLKSIDDGTTSPERVPSLIREDLRIWYEDVEGRAPDLVRRLRKV